MTVYDFHENVTEVQVDVRKSDFKCDMFLYINEKLPQRRRTRGGAQNVK